MDPPTDTERPLRKDLLLLKAVLDISDKASRLAGAARRRERTYGGYWKGGYGPHAEWGRRTNDGAQYFYIPVRHGERWRIPSAVGFSRLWVLDRIDEQEFWSSHGQWDGTGDSQGSPWESWLMSRESREMAEKWEAAGRRADTEIAHLIAAIAAGCRSRQAPRA